MNRQLYQNGGIMGVARENYGIGSKFKKFVRKVIPNEVADIAVKAAPFVAPFQPGVAAAMRGIGRFDQRGSISDAVKQAGATYAFGKATGADGLNVPGMFGSNASNSVGNAFNKPGDGTYQSLFTGDKTGGFLDTLTSNISGGIDGITNLIPESVRSIDIIGAIESGASSVGEFISKGFNSLVNADEKTLQELFKATTYLAGTTISFLDRKRINELREEIQAKFEAAQAGKRAQYNPGEATNAPKASFTAADVVRSSARYGGRMNYGNGTSKDEGWSGIHRAKRIWNILPDDIQGKYGNDFQRFFMGKDWEGVKMAEGGRIGYAYGNSVQDGIMSAPQIADQMGMPVGNPRQNQQGIAELDYRDQGGFVPPIGIKEKEDDIPAMLSNNEFVFTADAVRNAGDGDVNEGARKMYTMMKQLENGGMV